MVKLRVSNSDHLLAARHESTRSGFGIVPATIRNAGPKAVESFLCFFARAKNRHTGYVLRTAANHFFCWCDETALALETLRSGHVASFFESKRDMWKASTAATYCHSLRLLFKHLEDDRIIERSPLIGVAVPRREKPEKKEKVTLAELKAMVQEIDGVLKDLETFNELKAMVQEIDGVREGSETFNAMMVVLYPMLFGSMHCQEIAEFTEIPLQDVLTYAARLRENDCWTSGGRVCVAPESMNDNSLMILEIMLQTLCATGIMKPSAAPNAHPESAQGKPKETTVTIGSTSTVTPSASDSVTGRR